MEQGERYQRNEEEEEWMIWQKELKMRGRMKDKAS
jgi:hypothetical protein